MDTTDQYTQEEIPLSPKGIGTWVRKRRQTLSITQQELATSTNVSRQAIARLEKGSPDVRLSTALDAIQALRGQVNGA